MAENILNKTFIFFFKTAFFLILLPGNGSFRLCASELSKKSALNPDVYAIQEESIQTLPISLQGSICRNSRIVVNFMASGNFNAGNIFRAELSDSDGSFNTPIEIGNSTGSGNNVSSFIYCEVAVPAGNNYRIRVVSTNPSIIGSDNGQDLIIKNENAPGIPSVTVNGPTNFCFGSATTILTSSASNGNRWYPGGIDTNTFKGIVSSGCYYTNVASVSGCITSSIPVCIKVEEPIYSYLVLPDEDGIIFLSDTSVSLCEGDSMELAIVIDGGTPPFDILYSNSLQGLQSILAAGEFYGGNQYIHRFYVRETGTYSIVNISDRSNLNCSSISNSGIIGITQVSNPISSFYYPVFCPIEGKSMPPVLLDSNEIKGSFRFDIPSEDNAEIDPETGILSNIKPSGVYHIKYTTTIGECQFSSTTVLNVLPLEGEVTDSICNIASLESIREKSISENSKLIISPNPASDYITILQDGRLSAGKLEIIDIYGNRKIQTRLPSGIFQFELSIAFLDPGIYFVAIENTLNSKKYTKFVKVR